ncbi:hypothetical protein PoB_004187000 [Plakobranchus ocellatus]|uniref:Uncharacterized protein n=1 Tax=Plakobranchus ocellatus TaxID=259542 RepID=A0AAV4B743_9GAST|nr:hypothetical protein PoB_004187000 [Plakobranchus ocellatus]
MSEENITKFLGTINSTRQCRKDELFTKDELVPLNYNAIEESCTGIQTHTNLIIVNDDVPDHTTLICKSFVVPCVKGIDLLKWKFLVLHWYNYDIALRKKNGEDGRVDLDSVLKTTSNPRAECKTSVVNDVALENISVIFVDYYNPGPGICDFWALLIYPRDDVLFNETTEHCLVPPPEEEPADILVDIKTNLFTKDFKPVDYRDKEEDLDADEDQVHTNLILVNDDLPRCTTVISKTPLESPLLPHVRRLARDYFNVTNEEEILSWKYTVLHHLFYEIPEASLKKHYAVGLNMVLYDAHVRTGVVSDILGESVRGVFLKHDTRMIAFDYWVLLVYPDAAIQLPPPPPFRNTRGQKKKKALEEDYRYHLP